MDTVLLLLQLMMVRGVRWVAPDLIDQSRPQGCRIGVPSIECS